MPVTEQDIRGQYQDLLGRTDINPQAMSFWQGQADVNAVRQGIMNSAEYKARMAPPAAQVVPGGANPNIPNQINAMEYAGQVATDPQAAMTTDNPATPHLNESMFLSQRNGGSAAAQINGLDPKYSNTSGAHAYNPATVNPIAKPGVATYDPQKTYAAVMANQMTAAQGQVSDGAIIDENEVPQLDMQGMATGVNEDGTINHTGQALNKYASQNFTQIIDTSTVSGKLLAQSLGEGNYTDAKATLQGQMSILAKEFTDSTGNPKIPTWAQGTARNVSKIMNFKGVTGTAAQSAMSQALMEASIPIAQADAQFFQTLTVQNLTNRQQQVINTANVLSKMELSNLDNRMAAAVQNANNFMAMDLKNLDNEQQARVINTQARVQSILEDAKAVNTQRMFTAESTNEMNKFYDQLSSQIDQFNATQQNSAKQFNSNLANQQDQFYKEMQFNIDTANANWRQTITLQEDQQNFEAASTDVKNMLGISNEALNQIWDRSDHLLDYVWKTSESAKDRDAKLAMEQFKESAANSRANNEALGSLVGNFVSEGFESGFGNLIGNVFGGIF